MITAPPSWARTRHTWPTYCARASARSSTSPPAPASAEQSRRAAPPEISAPANLKAALTPPAGLRLVLAETEQQRTLREALAQSDGITSVALAIGPEGGWTQSELQQFAGTGWRAVSLGTDILRAETAAI